MHRLAKREQTRPLKVLAMATLHEIVAIEIHLPMGEVFGYWSMFRENGNCYQMIVFVKMFSYVVWMIAHDNLLRDGTLEDLKDFKLLINFCYSIVVALKLYHTGCFILV